MNGTSLARRQAVDLLYAAAAGVGTWDDALNGICGFIDARASHIALVPPRKTSGHAVGSYGHSTDSLGRYHAYGYAEDPTTSVIIENLGRPVSFEAMIERPVGTGRFFEEFILSRRTNHVLAMGLRSEAGTVFVKLSRKLSEPAFSPDDEARLQAMSEDFGRAVTLAETRRDTQTHMQFALDLVGSLRVPILRLSQDLALTYANSAAETVFRAHGKSLTHGRPIRLGSPAADDALRRYSALCRHGACPEPQLIPVGGALPGALARVWATPEMAGGFGLMLIDRNAVHSGLGHLLRIAFRLTAAEVRTALTMLECSGLAEVAERNGVSLETVRFHLKSIYDKTGTRRQSELICKLTMLSHIPES